MNRAFDTSVAYPTLNDCKRALRFGVILKEVRNRVVDALDEAEQEIQRLRDQLTNGAPTPPVVEEMPEHVTVEIQRAYRLRDEQGGDFPGYSWNCMLWLVDDRQRLADRVSELEIALQSSQQRAKEQSIRISGFRFRRLNYMLRWIGIELDTHELLTIDDEGRRFSFTRDGITRAFQWIADASDYKELPGRSKQRTET